ncbi:MAG: hypothetical protein AAB622_02215 [Patescibacteria group bacterium]
MDAQAANPPSEVATDALHGTPLDAPSAIQPGQSPQTPEVPKDSHWITILAMALFVIASLAIVAFLYYQNQQLKSMIASYQTPVASPTPSATVDPTSNWKTYTNDKYNFSFKYPGSEWGFSETNFTGSLNSYQLVNNVNKLVTIDVFVDNSWNGKGGVEKTQSNFTLSGIPAFRKSNPLGQNPPSEVIYVENNGKVLTIVLNYDDQTSIPEFDQILSTFKFLGTTPTSTCIPLPTCAYNQDPNVVCKIGEKPPDGGTWCPRPTPAY